MRHSQNQRLATFFRRHLNEAIAMPRLAKVISASSGPLRGVGLWPGRRIFDLRRRGWKIDLLETKRVGNQRRTFYAARKIGA